MLACMKLGPFPLGMPGGAEARTPDMPQCRFILDHYHAANFQCTIQHMLRPTCRTWPLGPLPPTQKRRPCRAAKPHEDRGAAMGASCIQLPSLQATKPFSTRPRLPLSPDGFRTSTLTGCNCQT